MNPQQDRCRPLRSKPKGWHKTPKPTAGPAGPPLGPAIIVAAREAGGSQLGGSRRLLLQLVHTKSTLKVSAQRGKCSVPARTHAKHSLHNHLLRLAA